MRIITDYLELHENVRQALQNADEETRGRIGILNYLQYNDLFLANGMCDKAAHDKLELLLKNGLFHFKN